MVGWTHPTQLIEGFILYLRKFSSFADSSVLIGVLRGAPDGVPIVLLIGPGQTGDSWDPIAISFAGLKLRKALRSAPIYLHCKTVDWPPYVEEFIRRSSCVVIDTTEESESLDIELKLITKHKKPSQIMHLEDKKKVSGNDIQPNSLVCRVGPTHQI